MLLKTVKNVAGSWLGLGTNMAVGFFLTPVILHRLGDSAFGLWVLIGAFTGYYGMLDLGIRNAIIRYVALHKETNEMEELTKVVSTGFVAYSCVAALASAFALIAAANVRVFFKVSPGEASTAQLLFLVVGIGTAIGMPIALFAGVLEGLQQFALVGVVQTVATLLRGAFIVAGIVSGYGIVFVGGVTVLVNLAASVLLMYASFRICSKNLLRFRSANRSTFSAMASFGVVTFWIGIAYMLRFQIDSWVVAACISLPAVAFFAAGGKLVTYTTEVVQTMAQVFTPMSSALHAKGSMDGLRKVLIVGNRYSAFIIFPMSAILLLIGPRFLKAWLGAEYVSSQSVLAILIGPTALFLAQATSTKILYGMARHKTLAFVLLAEGIANLILSVVLSRPYGIDGVAMGTAIPLFCTSVFFLPLHLCRLLQLRLRDFVFDSFVYPIVLTIPVAILVHLMDSRLPSRTLKELIGILAVAALLYGLELFAYFWFLDPEMTARRLNARAVNQVS